MLSSWASACSDDHVTRSWRVSTPEGLFFDVLDRGDSVGFAQRSHLLVGSCSPLMTPDNILTRNFSGILPPTLSHRRRPRLWRKRPLCPRSRWPPRSSALCRRVSPSWSATRWPWSSCASSITRASVCLLSAVCSRPCYCAHGTTRAYALQQSRILAELRVRRRGTCRVGTLVPPRAHRPRFVAVCLFLQTRPQRSPRLCAASVGLWMSSSPTRPWPCSPSSRATRVWPARCVCAHLCVLAPSLLSLPLGQAPGLVSFTVQDARGSLLPTFAPPGHWPGFLHSPECMASCLMKPACVRACPPLPYFRLSRAPPWFPSQSIMQGLLSDETRACACMPASCLFFAPPGFWLGILRSP